MRKVKSPETNRYDGFEPALIDRKSELWTPDYDSCSKPGAHERRMANKIFELSEALKERSSRLATEWASNKLQQLRQPREEMR